jgi:tRNA modification GTPase
MDLSQAEAVMDIIHARSERALEAARQQLRGSLGRRMGLLVEELLGGLARVEAYIDFPEEDLPGEDRRELRERLLRTRQAAGQLLATSHYGEILREGIKTVIIGEPNAGKSSLLNRLVGRERALVSSEPGTTRDFIEECILLGPHYLRLIDTAGLNPNPQPLERLGMEKTLERGDEADLFLVVLDPGHPTPPLPSSLRARLRPDNTVLVVNKADLGLSGPELAPELAPLPSVRVSALTGEGLELLRERIAQLADGFQQGVGSECVAINARHARALQRCQDSLQAALEKLDGRDPVELLASDLREALDACGEIAGRIDNERMLDALFATFCIGK